MSPFDELAIAARSRNAMRRSLARVTTTSKPFLRRMSERRVAMSSVTAFSVSFESAEAPGSLPPCPASMTTRRTERGKTEVDIGVMSSREAGERSPSSTTRGRGFLPFGTLWVGMTRGIAGGGGALFVRYVEPTNASGISSSGARCSQTRAMRRSGRTLRGGRPRIVSTFSATAPRTPCRLIRWIFPTLSILDSTRLLERPRVNRPQFHLAVFPRGAVPRIDERRAHVERVLCAAGVAPVIKVRLLRDRADRRVVHGEAPHEE